MGKKGANLEASPLTAGKKKTSRSNKTEEPIDKIIPEKEEKEEFIFIEDNMTVIFKRVQLGKFECPFYHQKKISVGSHIKKQNQ